MTTAAPNPAGRSDAAVVELAAQILAGSRQEACDSAQPAETVDTPSCLRYRAQDGHPVLPMERSMKQQVNLGEQLRRAVRGSGLTRNRIARDTGISYSVVHGFMAGVTDIQLTTASKIAAVVGVELCPSERSRKQ